MEYKEIIGLLSGCLLTAITVVMVVLHFAHYAATKKKNTKTWEETAQQRRASKNVNAQTVQTHKQPTAGGAATQDKSDQENFLEETGVDDLVLTAAECVRERRKHKTVRNRVRIRSSTSSTKSETASADEAQLSDDGFNEEELDLMRRTTEAVITKRGGSPDRQECTELSERAGNSVRSRRKNNSESQDNYVGDEGPEDKHEKETKYVHLKAHDSSGEEANATNSVSLLERGLSLSTGSSYWHPHATGRDVLYSLSQSYVARFRPWSTSSHSRGSVTTLDTMYSAPGDLFPTKRVSVISSNLINGSSCWWDSVTSLDTLYSEPPGFGSCGDRLSILNGSQGHSMLNKDLLISLSEFIRRNSYEVRSNKADFEAEATVSAPRCHVAVGGCLASVPQGGDKSSATIKVKCWLPKQDDGGGDAMVISPALGLDCDMTSNVKRPLSVSLPTCYTTKQGGKINIEWSTSGKVWRHLTEVSNPSTKFVEFQTVLSGCRFRSTISDASFPSIQKHLTSVIFLKKTGEHSGALVWCLCDATSYSEARLWLQMAPRCVYERVADIGTLTIGNDDSLELKMVLKDTSGGVQSTTTSSSGGTLSQHVLAEELWRAYTIKTFQFQLTKAVGDVITYFVKRGDEVLLSGILDLMPQHAETDLSGTEERHRRAVNDLKSRRKPVQRSKSSSTFRNFVNRVKGRKHTLF